MTNGIFEVMDVADLPAPKPWRDECQPGGPNRPWARLRRKLGHPECWYHGGDWVKVCDLSVAVLRLARQASVPDDRVNRWPAPGLSRWEKQALHSLLTRTWAITPDDEGYTNGNNRAAAIIASGAKRVVVFR